MFYWVMFYWMSVHCFPSAIPYLLACLFTTLCHTFCHLPLVLFEPNPHTLDANWLGCKESASKPKFINFPPCFLLTKKYLDASSLICPDIFRSCCWTVSLNLEKLIVVLCLVKWLKRHSPLFPPVNMYSVANKLYFAQKLMIPAFRKVTTHEKQAKI